MFTGNLCSNASFSHISETQRKDVNLYVKL